MNSDRRAGPASGFVVAVDEGQPFWFFNTLTINKVGSADSQGRLSVVDHRVPPGFAPPPHIHLESDETFFIIDGEFAGFCGDQAWSAGPGSLVYLPRRSRTALASLRLVLAGRSSWRHRWLRRAGGGFGRASC